MRKLLFTFFITSFCISLWGQSVVSGTVYDASDGSPLPGVSVKIEGTTKGTITDLMGVYSLSISDSDKEISFSFVGLTTKTEKLNGRSVINVYLEENTIVMNEVVVTALGIKRDAKALSSAQQTVSTERMSEVKDQNLVSSLSGKIAGVQVTPPQSATGSARIVIRGNSSFSGNNQPLFVVDGMPIDNDVNQDNLGGSNSTSGGLDMGSGAASLNPEDIESMTVLKGANAAALYGSRAANGVILITTKKASEGRFKVSVNSNAMFNYITQWPDLQNTFGIGHMAHFVGGERKYIDAETGLPDLRKYTETRSWGAPMMGQKYIGLDGKVYEYSPQPNNVYDFYKTARMLTNNISVEGGNADNNYRVSLTNVNANDVVDEQNLVNRTNINMRFYNTLFKKLTLDSKITLGSEETKNRQYLNGSAYNPLYIYIFMPRNMTLDQMTTYKNDQGREIVKFGEAHNPYWSINETENKDTKMRGLFNFDLSYQILPSLTAIAKYGREFVSVRNHEFKNNGAVQDTKGMYREATSIIDNSVMEFLLLYDKTIGGFSINGTLGANRTDYFGYNNWSRIASIKQSGFVHISNSDDFPTTDEHASKKRINSVFGALSVGYKSWIFADVTARNDWSSTLPIENSSYFYPSFGLSWIPTDMLNVPQSIVFGKLRASYAMVGNDTWAYRLYPTYSFNTTYNSYTFASLPGTRPPVNLKPEKTTSFEIGADLRFLNGRINLDFTYYSAVSKDQIIDAAMIPSSGYGNQVINAGSIRNRGIELATRFLPVQKPNFSWELGANFTKNNSLVMEMPDGKPIQLRVQWDSRIMIEEGKPYGIVRGKKWRTDDTGKRLVDSNGEAIWIEDQELGSAVPDWLMGISNQFRFFKNFELYFLLDIKKGGGIYSGSRRKGITAGVYSGLESELEDFWVRTEILGDQHSAGGKDLFGGYKFDDTYYFTIDDAGNYIAGDKCDVYVMPQHVGYYSDNFNEMTFYDASYVKLRELSISYNFPKKWISKAKMTNARLSLVGRNLWIIHQNTPKGLDPEAADNAGNAQGFELGGMPPNTTLGFDIKISF